MSSSTTALTAYDLSQARTINTESTNEVTLDSLPYIDNLHPDYEAYALTLIEEEMQGMGEPPSQEELLRHLPNPLGLGGDANTTPAFKSSREGNIINEKEYEDLVARHGKPRKETIDYRRKMKASMPKSKGTESEWEEAIMRAKIELEYERLKMVNAELQSEYETSLWKYQTKQIEAIANDLKSKLSQQQAEVDRINAKRKDMQTVKGGPKLHILGQKWDEGLNRVSLLADGVEKLKSEVVELRKQTGIEFKTEAKLNDSDDDNQ